MKQYYYLEENKLCGPVQVEEMRWKGLTKETLVWTEGMDDWKRAGDIAGINTKPANEPAMDKPAGKKFINHQNITGIFLKINRLPGILRNSNLIPTVKFPRMLKHSFNGVLFRLARFYQFMVK
jgi:hypothetical protein